MNFDSGQRTVLRRETGKDKGDVLAKTQTK